MKGTPQRLSMDSHVRTPDNRVGKVDAIQAGAVRVLFSRNDARIYPRHKLRVVRSPRDKAGAV